MLRRSLPALAGGLVEYHEWHLHEPLLKNYEGWRTLDNPKMTKMEAFVTDVGGCVRHLDPIIDDPRLTHRQRVCRLYRWSLKEMRQYITKPNASKFNLGYKVVRNRFEKYRYVTDPAMCDMMVRHSQKYLREICSPHYMRNDHRNPMACQCLTNPMFHPDNCLVYDHWTPAETMWYDDAKLHRYGNHHPMNSYSWEHHDRYGDIWEARVWARRPFFWFAICGYLYTYLYHCAFFYQEGETDARFLQYAQHFETEVLATMANEERASRASFAVSALNHNWDSILGTAVQKEGYGRLWHRNIEREQHRETPRNVNQPAPSKTNEAA
jgi:hypothetical protein